MIVVAELSTGDFTNDDPTLRNNVRTQCSSHKVAKRFKRVKMGTMLSRQKGSARTTSGMGSSEVALPPRSARTCSARAGRNRDFTAQAARPYGIAGPIILIGGGHSQAVSPLPQGVVFPADYRISSMA
jgi:hypothetical protein